MAKRKIKLGKQKTVSYGFVGRWKDDTLGWMLPTHLCHPPNRPKHEIWNSNQPMVLCKITVEMVKNKNGRSIVRYMPTSGQLK